MPCLVAEIAVLREEKAILREDAKKVEGNVAVSKGLWEEVLNVKEAIVELLPAAGKAQTLRVNVKRKVRLLDIELSIF